MLTLQRVGVMIENGYGILRILILILTSGLLLFVVLMDIHASDCVVR